MRSKILSLLLVILTLYSCGNGDSEKNERSGADSAKSLSSAAHIHNPAIFDTVAYKEYAAYFHDATAEEKRMYFKAMIANGESYHIQTDDLRTICNYCNNTVYIYDGINAQDENIFILVAFNPEGQVIPGSCMLYSKYVKCPRFCDIQSALSISYAEAQGYVNRFLTATIATGELNRTRITRAMCTSITTSNDAYFDISFASHHYNIITAIALDFPATPPNPAIAAPAPPRPPVAPAPTAAPHTPPILVKPRMGASMMHQPLTGNIDRAPL
ncbi:MAG TPA: hypothetical protein VEB40_14610 [Flavipsychrobacter sp.]|nr:hypothetical protein [Flavipsychrobacter sp.]